MTNHKSYSKNLFSSSTIHQSKYNVNVSDTPELKFFTPIRYIPFKIPKYYSKQFSKVNEINQVVFP